MGPIVITYVYNATQATGISCKGVMPQPFSMGDEIQVVAAENVELESLIGRQCSEKFE